MQAQPIHFRVTHPSGEEKKKLDFEQVFPISFCPNVWTFACNDKLRMRECVQTHALLRHTVRLSRVKWGFSLIARPLCVCACVCVVNSDRGWTELSPFRAFYLAIEWCHVFNAVVRSDTSVVSLGRHTQSSLYIAAAAA